ncbi:MAG: hypothetical protein CVT59_03330 [Actinobacteria bacterium HGW-Actinobacteria-1]|jgi:hypothetical protein|nr:MAG: hypothetical protein CVT59_03330 [Actinobacteria bacterium HGW-Actinobacteria-1]
MVSSDVSVIRLADADVDNVESVRALLADSLAEPRPRVLADLTGLTGLRGPLIAAIIIAAHELGADARFAVYAPEHIFQQMQDWKISEAWPCFDDWDKATEYLCRDAS